MLCTHGWMSQWIYWSSSDSLQKRGKGNLLPLTVLVLKPSQRLKNRSSTVSSEAKETPIGERKSCCR